MIDTTSRLANRIQKRGSSGRPHRFGGCATRETRHLMNVDLPRCDPPYKSRPALQIQSDLWSPLNWLANRGPGVGSVRPGAER